MAESGNKAAELLELGKAMSDYGQILDQAVSNAHRIIEEVDASVTKAIQDAADGAGGWGLDRESEDYQAQRRAMTKLLRQLEAAAGRYREARDNLLSITSNGAGSEDCFAARASLERLAGALEAYYGVRLLEDAATEETSSQKVKTKRRL